MKSLAMASKNPYGNVQLCFEGSVSMYVLVPGQRIYVSHYNPRQSNDPLQLAGLKDSG